MTSPRARLLSSCLAFAMLGVGLSSCSSGGGGGRLDLVPTLVSAVFVGATSTPAANDRLRLLFSEDVQVSAAVLSDPDVTLSAGSLGAVGAAPTLVSSRVIEVTLGAGVTFTPGTTTIDLAVANDAVRDLSGNLVQASAAVVISEGDAEDPIIGSVTLNSVDGLTNGTGPAAGIMLVPLNGFTIDVTHSDVTSAVDPARTVISLNAEINANGVKKAVGENLLSSFTAAAGATSSSYTVPANVFFPAGDLQLTLLVVDTTGRVSAPRTFSFRVAAINNGIRPFEAQQTWFLDLTRDVESYTVNLANTATPVEITDGANNATDLEELFATIGLQNPSSPIPNVSGNKNSDVVVMDLFREELTTQLGNLFASVNIAFTFTSPGTFPAATSVPFSAAGFSQICISGSQDTTGTTGVLGLAILDPNNGSHENNCLLNFGAGSDRLGVFLHTVINTGFRSSVLATFRSTYDTFTPSRGGNAIGADGADAGRLQNILANTSGDGRQDAIEAAINRMARFTAVVTAHECGHSMGLVANGAMPVGLYGGDAVNFPGSNSAHISLPSSLFPAGSVNIMNPALGFTSSQSSNTGFGSLNLAYLREQVLYTN